MSQRGWPSIMYPGMKTRVRPAPGQSRVPNSIFLAGPTLREPNTGRSWRNHAIETFRELGFTGHLFAPEWWHDGKPVSFETQVEWETEMLEAAACIMFWIPRDMETLPGLTTNDEWGYWKARDPLKCVLGVPPGAPHTKYQIWWARKLFIPVHTTLLGTCSAAAQIARRP